MSEVNEEIKKVVEQAVQPQITNLDAVVAELPLTKPQRVSLEKAINGVTQGIQLLINTSNAEVGKKQETIEKLIAKETEKKVDKKK